MSGNEPFQFIQRIIQVPGIKDIAEFIGHLFAQMNLGNILNRVLDQMKLATLPGRSSEHVLSCLFQAFVRITDDHETQRGQDSLRAVD